MRWRYRAAAADGAAVRGEIDAPTERDAVDALRRQTLWVVELNAVDEVGRWSDGDERSARPSRFAAGWASRARTETDLATVFRAVATLLSAGVPLVRALSYAEQDSATPALRAAFASVRAAIARGESLSAALRAQPVFPSVFAPLIAAGEESGTLDASLALLAEHLERRVALREQVQSALLYPAILGTASIVGVVVILLVVVPRFAELIADSGGTLPLSTRLLLGLSAAVTRGWWIILLGLGAGAAVFAQLRSDERWRTTFDQQRLRWPVLGELERLRESASYTRTMAVALRAGVTLLSAMGLARAVVGNRAMRRSLAEAESRVRGGDRLLASLAGVLPPLAERLLEAGETSGDLAGMAARAAEATDDAVQRMLRRAVALIEPVMILGFGGVVAFVALALLQAIYGLNSRVL